MARIIDGENMNLIGANVKKYRKKKKMSQEELGQRVGVQRAAINKYEKGSVINIPITTIEKIAQVFDVSPTYIVGWDNIRSGSLSEEVKTVQGVKLHYGSDSVDLLELYTHLSPLGKKRVFQYLEDMSLIYPKAEEIVKGKH
jgi:transcriptional regulator with XRE-family HTH domain